MERVPDDYGSPADMSMSGHALVASPPPTPINLAVDKTIIMPSDLEELTRLKPIGMDSEAPLALDATAPVASTTAKEVDPTGKGVDMEDDEEKDSDSEDEGKKSDDDEGKKSDEEDEKISDEDDGKKSDDDEGKKSDEEEGKKSDEDEGKESDSQDEEDMELEPDINLANVKMEVDPEDAEPDPAIWASKMFRNCVFCYNALPVPTQPAHDENDESCSWSHDNETELDFRAFDIVGKYLQVKLEDTYQKFLNGEGLPTSLSPFCSNCVKTIQSLLQLDEKLTLVQTQITSRIEFLTNNIMQSTERELEYLQAQTQKENQEPDVSPTAGKTFENLRKKVLNRFCPKVLLIPLEQERIATRRQTRKRKAALNPKTWPVAPAAPAEDNSDADLAHFDLFDSPAAESDGDPNSGLDDSDFNPEEHAPLRQKKPRASGDARYRKKLRKRKSADTEFITVEPEIPFIKEEALSDQDEPEPEKPASDAEDPDVEAEAVKSDSVSSDDSDTDYEARKPKRKRELEFAKSEKGKDLLLLDGYIYNFHSYGADNKTLWRCSQVRKTKCKCRIHSRGHDILYVSAKHTCSIPSPETLTKLRIISNMKTIAQSTTETPAAVLALTCEGIPDSVMEQLPAISSLKRSIRRLRDENRKAPRRAVRRSKKKKKTGPKRPYTFRNRERKSTVDPYKIVTNEEGKHFVGDIELIEITGGFKCSRCGEEEVRIFGSLFKARAHAISHFRNIQCDVCGKSFSSRNVMRKHKQGVHDRIWSTECDICLRPFKTSKAVIAHKWNHQSEAEKEAAILSGIEPPPPPNYRSTVGVYPCEICGSVLKSKGSLFKHVQNHTAAKNSVCDTCGKLFTVNGLRDHKRYCHVTTATHRIWHCNICDKPYNTKDNLRRHINSVHKENTVLCEVCQKPMKGSKGLPSHIWTHKSAQDRADHIAAGLKAPVTGKEHYKKQVGAFPCTICAKVLTSKGALVKHLQRHEEIAEGKTHLCPDCGKMFPTSEDMKSHQRYIHVVVNDRKHFICKTCGMRFAVESRMKLHEMTHTGEKPYTCNVCGKAFRRAHPLKKHMKTHEAGSAEYVGDAPPRRPAASGRSRKSKAKPPKEPERIQTQSASNSSEFQTSEPSHGSHSHGHSSYHHHLHSPNGNLVIPGHPMNYQHSHQHPNNPIPYDPLNYTNYIYQGGFNLSNM